MLASWFLRRWKRISDKALFNEITKDIREGFFSYILLVMVVFTAFAIIYVTHLGRNLTSEIEKTSDRVGELDTEKRHLVLEISTLGEYNRVGLIVQSELGMRIPSNEDIIMLKIKHEN